MSTALTTVEAGEFERLKQTIRAGQQTFVEVGLAYAAIREQRLYRATHGTFDAFCRDEFSLSKREVDRTIEAAAVVKRLGPIVPTAAHKSQVRPLTKLPPAEQPAAWQEAVAKSGGKAPTAKTVAAVVAERKEVHAPAERLHPAVDPRVTLGGLKHFWKQTPLPNAFEAADAATKKAFAAWIATKAL